jgi:hypothetical protein
MGAGDRNIKGKPKDIVKHFSHEDAGEPVCLTKHYGYSTKNISDVTCLKCKKKIIKDNIWYEGK